MTVTDTPAGTSGLVFTAFVTVTDDQFEHHHFGPGDPVPKWAVPLVGDHVTQPAALPPGTGGNKVDPVAQHADEEEAAESSEAVALLAAHLQEHAKFGGLDLPPTSGPGSGRTAWVVAARKIGVPVEPGMNRADIMRAIDQHTGA